MASGQRLLGHNGSHIPVAPSTAACCDYAYVLQHRTARPGQHSNDGQDDECTCCNKLRPSSLNHDLDQTPTRASHLPDKHVLNAGATPVSDYGSETGSRRTTISAAPTTLSAADEALLGTFMEVLAEGEEQLRGRTVFFASFWLNERQWRPGHLRAGGQIRRFGAFCSLGLCFSLLHHCDEPTTFRRPVSRQASLTYFTPFPSHLLQRIHQDCRLRSTVPRSGPGRRPCG